MRINDGFKIIDQLDDSGSGTSRFTKIYTFTFAKKDEGAEEIIQKRSSSLKNSFY